MIEFTLSKINLLILAVALFSIISFFTLNVGKIFLVSEVKQDLDKYSITLNGMIIAPTTCDSSPFVLQPKYTSFGNNVYYHLHASAIPDPNGNRLVFSVTDIRSPNVVLAASSLATTATIQLYDSPSGTFIPLGEGDELVLDPQSVPPRNAFYAIKSVKGGRSTLYILPCSITPNSETCSGPNGAKAQVNALLPAEEQFVC